MSYSKYIRKHGLPGSLTCLKVLVDADGIILWSQDANSHLCSSWFWKVPASLSHSLSTKPLSSTAQSTPGDPCSCFGHEASPTSCPKLVLIWTPALLSLCFCLVRAGWYPQKVGRDKAKNSCRGGSQRPGLTPGPAFSCCLNMCWLLNQPLQTSASSAIKMGILVSTWRCLQSTVTLACRNFSVHLSGTPPSSVCESPLSQTQVSSSRFLYNRSPPAFFESGDSILHSNCRHRCVWPCASALLKNILLAFHWQQNKIPVESRWLRRAPRADQWVPRSSISSCPNCHAHTSICHMHAHTHSRMGLCTHTPPTA